jgi:uncharacterized membrane protein YoaK (UPF0700 family)
MESGPVGKAIVAASFPREEALQIAAMLAFVGGYLDAFTWIIHRTFANAQTANLVFLWVYVTGGEWEKALRYVPPLAAFALGVIMASYLRLFAGSKAGQISILVEIIFLFIVAILHNRLAEMAGTLGISFVAAMQTATFPKVEGWNYSSVMATTNFRQSIESLFAMVAGAPEPNRFRKPYVYGAICVAFGAGAALGAFTTEQLAGYSLAIPAMMLVIVLLHCAQSMPVVARN